MSIDKFIIITKIETSIILNGFMCCILKYEQENILNTVY